MIDENDKIFMPGMEDIPVPEVTVATHPGVMLQEMYLYEIGMTPQDFARHIGVAPTEIADLVGEKSAVTPVLAMRLGQALGTGPQLWMNAQQNYDFARELRRLRETGAIKEVEAVPALIDTK